MFPQHRTSVLGAALLLSGIAAILWLMVGLPMSAQEQGKQRAVPDEAALDQARDTITKLFASKFKNAKTDKSAAKTLAAELLEQARATKDDDSLQFMALKLAGELVAGTGDKAAALDIIQELCRSFKVDANELKDAMFGQGEKNTTSKKVALLVGVSRYQTEDLTDLQFAENDATALAAVLKGAGYRVTVLTNSAGEQNSSQAPTAANVRLRLKQILKSCGTGDTVVLGFAGHGVQFKGEKVPYFCPADARLAERKTLVSLTEVYKELEQCKADHKLLLVDACRKDPRRRAEVDLESVTRPQIVPPPRGVAAVFSCSEGQFAFESPTLKQGVFFHYIIQGLKGAAADKQGAVSLYGLVNYVGPKVTAHVKQEFGGKSQQRLALKADLEGELSLVERTPAATTTKEESVPPKKEKPVLPVDVQITTELYKIDNAHGGGVQSVAISDDGQLILSGGMSNNTVSLWNATTGQKIRDLIGHTGSIQGVAISPDKKYGLSGSTDSSMRLWDLSTGKEARRFLGHKDWIRAVYFLPGGTQVLSACDDKHLRIFDLNDGKMARQIPAHTKYINGLGLSQDGKRAITCSDDFTAKVWDLTTGQLKQSLPYQKQVQFAVLSSDGKRAATTVTGDKLVKIWDADTGKELLQLPQPIPVLRLAISPDGRRLFCGGGTGQVGDQFNQIRVLDMDTGAEVRQLSGHTNFVRGLAMTPDGRFLVSGSQDGSVRLWGAK